MPHVTLTTVQPEDFEALVALRIEAMRESLERVGRFDPVRARERFREGFSAPDTRYIEVAGNRVGFVVVKALAEADAAASTLRVGALKESDSNRFYLRHGFQLVESGEFDNYYVRPNV
ncbi:GNAT family N-acetyltransferase [Pseudomonas avellanae]|uniref:GNAT family N-acetyltransferase n=1 Tax=Pseudomonas avellanae TaxID=46257 RepID=A0AAD0M6I6_9PSED|nr:MULTISPECIES: GNAT family N-acetyltransferase [Pseudomonas syringae group]AVB23281.1 GNAT family N-acetyltransferase [Pseudomonas avellanae]POP76329.1 GNAT family N-acetyltransferase [Pseudomonas amygdali pv. morsprunorum]